MTLEQTTERILNAAAAQDLDALEAACAERASAMTTLSSRQPTLELRAAILKSAAAGEEARQALRAIRQRLRKDSRRLTNIEQGFLRAVPANHQIDCAG